MLHFSHPMSRSSILSLPPTELHPPFVIIPLLHPSGTSLSCSCLWQCSHVWMSSREYILWTERKGVALSHCSSQCYTATAIPFIYSFSGNSAASASISTFMCLWAIYIFTGSVYIFPTAEQADSLWEYIIRSLTHECGNWDWGPDIPFLRIFVSNFRHFVFVVYLYNVSVAMLGLNHAANHYSTLKKTMLFALLKNHSIQLFV